MRSRRFGSGGRKKERGARGTHVKEKGPYSKACLSRPLRSFLRVTSRRLLRRLKIRQLLVKMASLTFRYKEKNPKNV